MSGAIAGYEAPYDASRLFPSSFFGFIKRFLWRKTFSYESVVYRVTDKFCSASVYNQYFFAFVVNPYIFSLVSRLLRNRSPFYVSRLIISVYVNALYSKSVGISDIRKKKLKILKYRVYRYASATIVFVAFYVWVETSHHHATPRRVLACYFTVNGLPVCRKALFCFLRRQFALKTAAAMRLAFCKRGRNEVFLRTAIAPACNAYAPAYSAKMGCNSPSTEFLTYKRLGRSTRCMYALFSHSSPYLQKVRSGARPCRDSAVSHSIARALEWQA